MFNKKLNIKQLRAQYKLFELESLSSRQKLFSISNDLTKALEELSNDVLSIRHIDGKPWIYFKGSTIEEFEKAIETFNKIREYL